MDMIRVQLKQQSTGDKEDIQGAEHEFCETDVLVIGGGIAGAFAAIRARDSGARVLLVDKACFGRSGTSALASGVFLTYMPGDDMQEWQRSAPGPFVNRGAFERAIVLTYDLLLLMDKWGVKWVKQAGQVVRVRGASGPSFPSNAMLAEGGPQMMMALRNQALRQGVQVVNRVMVTDLLTSDGKHPTRGSVIGAIGFDTITGQVRVFKAKATVMCTGPIGFPYPTIGRGLHGMPIDSSGDGAAAAFRAGARLRKMELSGGQLYPAEFRCAPALEMGTELGMRFFNAGGQELLAEEKLEDRGRSKLAATVRKEYAEGRGPVFMGMPDISVERLMLFKRVVPIVASTFERAGYVLDRDRIPYLDIFPAQWGIVGGGIRAEETGETSLPGLYTAGNTSDGAYIGSAQPLALCAVLGWYAGDNATRYAPDPVEPQPEQLSELTHAVLAPLRRETGVRFDQVRAPLQELYGAEITRVLNGERIERALAKVRDIKTNLVPQLSAREPRELVKAISMRNFAELLEICLMVLLHRTESRATAIRDDYPETDNDTWLNYTTVVRNQNGQPVLWDEPVPESPDYWLPKERKKYVHPFLRR